MTQRNPKINFLFTYSIYNNDEEKLGSVRRYFCNNISPEVNTYTLEASLLGYIPDPNSDEAPIPGETPIDNAVGGSTAPGWHTHPKRNTNQ